MLGPESRTRKATAGAANFGRNADRNIGSWIKNSIEITSGYAKVVLVGGAALVGVFWVADKLDGTAREIAAEASAKLPEVDVPVVNVNIGDTEKPTDVIPSAILDVDQKALLADCSDSTPVTVESGDTVFGLIGGLNPALQGETAAIEGIVHEEFSAANLGINPSVIAKDQTINIPTDCVLVSLD